MKLLPLSQPFNRGNLLPLMHNCQRQTGEGWLPIDEDGTGTTGAMIAAFLGSGQSEMFTQCIKESHASIEQQRMIGSVDTQCHSDKLCICRCICRNGHHFLLNGPCSVQT